MSQSVRETVASVITKTLKDAGRPVPEIADDSSIGESLKLDSLDLAVVVVALESELNVDPFRSGAQPVQTFGDLVKLYEGAIDG